MLLGFEFRAILLLIAGVGLLYQAIATLLGLPGSMAGRIKPGWRLWAPAIEALAGLIAVFAAFIAHLNLIWVGLVGFVLMLVLVQAFASPFEDRSSLDEDD